MAQVLNSLDEVPLFQLFEAAERSRIAERFSRVAFKPDSVIVAEHERETGLYVLLSGKVKVTKQLDGRQVPLAVLQAREVFGEMSLIDGRPSSATIAAVGPAEVLHLSPEGFRSLLANDPRIAAIFWQGMAKLLSERVRRTNERIHEFVEFNKAICQNETFRDFYVLCQFG